MQKIFQESNKPFAVFRFFVLLMGTLNVKTKEWHMSQDGMAVNWEYSKSTVNGYFTQLEDMKLVYVYRHNKRRTDGTYRKINNSYSICQLLNLPYTEHYFSLCNNPFKLYNCFHLISIIFYLIE